MANTAFEKLGSQDILSAHINGIQYSLGSLETALQIGTVAVKGASLVPVIDMEDTAVRYRIYEADKRGWLFSPAPIIYRNGVVVSVQEFTIQPAYGVIVFIAQQRDTDVITADFTHVSGDSERLKSIEVKANKVATLEADVSTLKTDVDAVEVRVGTLESSGGGSTGGAKPVIINPNEKILTNVHDIADLSSVYMTAGVLTGTDTIDMFPFFVEYPVAVSSIMIATSAGNWAVSYQTTLGIYSSVNGLPQELIAQTADFQASGDGITFDKPLTRGKDGSALSGAVILQKGLYFTARFSNNQFSQTALRTTVAESVGKVIEIKAPKSTAYRNVNGSDFYSGYRLDNSTTLPIGNASKLPATLPATLTSYFRALARTVTSSVQVKTVSVGG